MAKKSPGRSKPDHRELRLMVTQSSMSAYPKFVEHMQGRRSIPRTYFSEAKEKLDLC